MKEIIDESIEWIKSQPIQGCITGSCLLDYFEGQDVDIFVYDKKSFTKLIFAMHHNDKFCILDPIEKWKFEQYINVETDNFYKLGLITIKFTYNTCVPINIILKKNCTNIFSVLATFDLDIISKGYDIQTKKYLDLSEGLPNKTATWNKWNTSYYSFEVWKISRVLRQLERCFKYHKRGYNTDTVVQKYMELIDRIQDYTNIFESESFSEKIKETKVNTLIVKKICEVWLENHTINEDDLVLLKEKVKKI